MSLNKIIAPEITSDSFYSLLKATAKRRDLKTFLEIGSSSGDGSTRALATGIMEREQRDAELFCMELSRARFLKLVKEYEGCEFLFPYNLSSVKTSEFPTKLAVTKFYESIKTNLNRVDLNTVLRWWQQDIDYINQNRMNFCGIDIIKSCNSIEVFDFVLIDGSEFTGEAELQHVWGSKVIALDDVNAHKCFQAYVRLSNHYAYRLISEDLTLRNGYAFFERTY